MPGARKPTGNQLAWNNAGNHGMKKDGLKRAQQIVRQRQQTPYVPEIPHCIVCLAPRDRRSYPVCEDCHIKRKQGVR